MAEIEDIWQDYPDLSQHERLFVVLDELVKKSIELDDYTQLPSLNELAKKFEGLFVNPKTGMPTADAINWIRKLATKIKKDKGHPNIRPYTEPHIEIAVDGTEVLRWYLNLLRGSAAVNRVNTALETQRTALKEIQATNRDLVNVKKVLKEAEQYREELEIKQQEAIRKRKRK